MSQVLTLHFIDGTKLGFDFPRQAANVAARKMKLADFMSAKHVVIEADGQVYVMPVANIKYIALSAPGVDSKSAGYALPAHAIVGARVRS
jgi:hypothetical protein